MVKRLYQCPLKNYIVVDVDEKTPLVLCIDSDSFTFDQCKSCENVNSIYTGNNGISFENIYTHLTFEAGKCKYSKCCVFKAIKNEEVVVLGKSEASHIVDEFVGKPVEKPVETKQPCDWNTNTQSRVNDIYAKNLNTESSCTCDGVLKSTETRKTGPRSVSKCNCGCKHSEDVTSDLKSDKCGKHKPHNIVIPDTPDFDVRNNPRFSKEENEMLRLCPTTKVARKRYVEKYGNVRTNKSIENQYYRIKNKDGIFKPGEKFVVTQRSSLLCGKVVTIDTISEGNSYLFVRDGAGTRMSVEIKYLKKV